jgi:hypothetical protein
MSVITPKYPHVHVQLTGEDGNAFSILARVQKALTKAQVPASEIELFMSTATSGDFDHLLQTVMRYVDWS